ncbi:MAG: hypothetical protein ACO3YZ_04755 [Candidatus Nanopelagicaceae bacterium]
MASNQTPAFPGDYYYSSYSTTLLPPSFLPPAPPVRRPIPNIPPYSESGLPPQPRQPRPTVPAPPSPPALASGPVAIPYPAPPTPSSSSPILTFSPTADAPRIPGPMDPQRWWDVRPSSEPPYAATSQPRPSRLSPELTDYLDDISPVQFAPPSQVIFDAPGIPAPVVIDAAGKRASYAASNPTPPPASVPAAAKPPDPESFFNFTAGGRLQPGTLAHSFANPGPVDLLFSAVTAPFTYQAYKQMGATNAQALAGTVGSEAGGIGGGLAGARGGALLGARFGPQAAIGGAVIGGLLGSQLGYRGGSKLADEASGLNEQFRQQQQAQYPEQMQAQALEQQQAQYPEQMQAPLPQLTQEEKIRQQVYAQAFNPYLPYMMQQMQLGGY